MKDNKNRKCIESVAGDVVEGLALYEERPLTEAGMDLIPDFIKTYYRGEKDKAIDLLTRIKKERKHDVVDYMEEIVENMPDTHEIAEEDEDILVTMEQLFALIPSSLTSGS